tara:strand:- start:1040 stop:2155 length:1116 start_codon:yes stop_codon:yes gene_type:complete
MRLENKNILIISPESWGNNYVSKHHYSLELIKRGNKVVFLNPSKNGNIFSNRNFYTQIKGLTIINPPTFLRGLNYFPFKYRKRVHTYQANSIKRILDQSFDIVWSFDPFRFQNLQSFKSQLCIYHAMDFHNSKVESDVIKSADIVFTVSKMLEDRIKLENDKCYKIPHGLSDPFIHKITELPTIVKKSNKINVGCVGNLHYPYLDTEIFKKIIEDNNKIHFNFIGPISNSNLSSKTININFVRFLKSMSNVSLYGSVKSKELPKYFNKFDLFLICYNSDLYKTHTSNNHKILEFLSTGKVIVSHYIDEYKNTNNLVSMSSKLSELPLLFKKVVSELELYNNPTMMDLRRNYAQKNSYSNQLNKIQYYLNKF